MNGTTSWKTKAFKFLDFKLSEYDRNIKQVKNYAEKKLNKTFIPK